MEIANEIHKKQENAPIGEWRMHAVLLQESIKVGYLRMVAFPEAA